MVTHSTGSASDVPAHPTMNHAALADGTALALPVWLQAVHSVCIHASSDSAVVVQQSSYLTFLNLLIYSWLALPSWPLANRKSKDAMIVATL